MDGTTASYTAMIQAGGQISVALVVCIRRGFALTPTGEGKALSTTLSSFRLVWMLVVWRAWLLEGPAFCFPSCPVVCAIPVPWLSGSLLRTSQRRIQECGLYGQSLKESVDATHLPSSTLIALLGPHIFFRSSGRRLYLRSYISPTPLMFITCILSITILITIVMNFYLRHLFTFMNFFTCTMLHASVPSKKKQKAYERGKHYSNLSNF